MWRNISLLIIVCVLFVSCTPKKTPEPAVVDEPAVVVAETVAAVEETASALEKEMQAYAQAPMHWTLELQKKNYDQLFAAGSLVKALEFREFVESLAQYHHDEPVYEYNPVILCYEKYPEYIPLVYEVKPELFLSGSLKEGMYQESPFLYVVKNGTLEDVKFYFENSIPCLDAGADRLYGSTNRGGPRFGPGGNILLYAEKPEIRDYLISQGVPESVEPVSYFYYYLTKDEVEMHSGPGFDGDPVMTLAKTTSFTPMAILTYKVDGTQWLKILADGTEGWVPMNCIGYDTGI